jgi:hypothetical protein
MLVTFYLSAFFTLARILNQNDIVIAKTDPPLISVAAALAAWLRGARLVNWLQDVFPEVAMRLGALRLPGWCVRAMLAVRNRSLRAARCNVAIDPGMKRHLATLGLDPGRFRAVTHLDVSGDDIGEAIMRIAGHVSRAMLSRYSHVRMEAKRRALDEIAARQRAADEKRREKA